MLMAQKKFLKFSILCKFAIDTKAHLTLTTIKLIFNLKTLYDTLKEII